MAYGLDLPSMVVFTQRAAGLHVLMREAECHICVHTAVPSASALHREAYAPSFSGISITWLYKTDRTVSPALGMLNPESLGMLNRILTLLCREQLSTSRRPAPCKSATVHSPGSLASTSPENVELPRTAVDALGAFLYMGTELCGRFDYPTHSWWQRSCFHTKQT